MYYIKWTGSQVNKDQQSKDWEIGPPISYTFGGFIAYPNIILPNLT
jgi:hypothetical protein